MNTPLFSLLIAQYNNGQYFQDCYNSIIAQTYPNWEAVIVDDCSTDDSVAQMEKLIGDDPRFKLYRNGKNEGCGYTKRRLTELAQGELCAFLDPDDAITPDALQLMVAEHQKHTKAAVVYSRPFLCDEQLNIEHEVSSVQIVNGDPYFFDLEGKLFAFLSFKKEFYDKTDGISAYLLRAVDRDLVLKLYETGSCLFFDKALYLYRLHKNGISTNQNQDKAYYWLWVTIIDAARRRKVNIENLFLEKALNGPTKIALQKEIDGYNKSFVFRIMRKLGLFKI